MTINRYRITYIRADGRNTPGVDVPFPVDGAVTATLRPTPTVVPFEMVRHQQKLEQPLRSLASFGGRLFISTIAEITFYGADQVGNDVQAKATMSVSFSDYADPDVLRTDRRSKMEPKFMTKYIRCVLVLMTAAIARRVHDDRYRSAAAWRDRPR